MSDMPSTGFTYASFNTASDAHDYVAYPASSAATCDDTDAPTSAIWARVRRWDVVMWRQGLFKRQNHARFRNESSLQTI